MEKCAGASHIWNDLVGLLRIFEVTNIIGYLVDSSKTSPIIIGSDKISDNYRQAITCRPSSIEIGLVVNKLGLVCGSFSILSLVPLSPSYFNHTDPCGPDLA